MSDFTRIELNESDQRAVKRLRRDLDYLKAAATAGDDYPWIAGRLQVLAENLLRILDTPSPDHTD